MKKKWKEQQDQKTEINCTSEIYDKYLENKNCGFLIKFWSTRK